MACDPRNAADEPEVTVPSLSKVDSILAFGLMGILMAAFLGVVPTVAVGIRDEAMTSRAIDVALADPAFRERASDAGYRIEKAVGFGGPNRVRYLLARCARANEVGPLPCAPFPDDPAHPGIPVEVRP